jgi:hypothetical protein
MSQDSVDASGRADSWNGDSDEDASLRSDLDHRGEDGHSDDGSADERADQQYFQWSARRSSTAAASSTSSSIYQIDEDDFAQCCRSGDFKDGDLAARFGIPRSAVEHRKRSLRLTWSKHGGRRLRLPAFDELEAMWEDNPSLTLAAAAQTLKVDLAKVTLLLPLTPTHTLNPAPYRT